MRTLKELDFTKRFVYSWTKGFGIVIGQKGNNWKVRWYEYSTPLETCHSNEDLIILLHMYVEAIKDAPVSRG